MPADGEPAIAENELRVLVIPPTRADAAAMAKLLAAAAIKSEFFENMAALCQAITGGAGLAIVSEEALVGELDQLSACIGDQPVWSDMPIIVLSRSGAESSQLTLALQRVGNASVVERPVRITTLISLIRSALRARERQYQVRAQLVERDRAAHAIREGERRYRMLIENISDYAIFMIDIKGNVSGWNDGAEQILGYSAEEVIGKSATIFFTPEDCAAGVPEQEMRTAIAVGRSTDIRWHIRKDGVRLFVDGAMTAVRDDEENLIGFSKVMKDITERHRIEVERERLLESEREARTEAERAGRMKDEFLATLSHELRTPLNAMLGWSQLLRNTPGLPTDIEEGLSIIERNARSQTQIIQDLLDMSRIISGKVHMDVQQIDLISVLKSAIASVRPAAEARGVHVSLVSEYQSCVLPADASRMQQVFWNLLTNAVKFTPKDGSVTIELVCDDRNVHIRVSDTGEGIDPAFLPHVFDRFRQADASTTRKHGGLGLGLSIVKQLVELHGGSITASSDGIQRGSTFSVVLPLAGPRADLEEPKREQEITSHAPRAVEKSNHAGQLVSIRVLVVDDELDARNLLRRLLEEAHATVFTAASAPEALELLVRYQPDVLVSDIGMPEEDGYSLIHQVRSMHAAQGGTTPAIALTAYARGDDRTKVMNAGFQMYMTKPVEAAELIATIAGLTSPHNASSLVDLR